LRSILSIFIVILFAITFSPSGGILLAQQPAPDQPPAQKENVLQPQLLQPVQPFQPAPQPQQQAPLPEIQPNAIKKPLAKKDEVSFNFDDADIFSVIQTIFGDVLRVNYIVDPNVKGRVNFRSVAPVAKENVLPLMEVILRLNGIAVVEEGGLYRIIPIGDISKEPTPIGIGRESETVKITGKALLQVVPVRYIISSELVKLLTPFLSKNAVIVDVPKINYIIIVDTDANVKRLLQLVEIFDSEQLKRVKPKVFVYPVQNSKAKDVAALLQQIFLGAKPSTAPTPPATARPTMRTPTPGQPLQPGAISEPQVFMGQEGGEALVSEITKIFPDEVTNTVIILAIPDDYELIAETIKKIDIVPRQVVIEALIAQVKLTDALDFGMQWTIQNDLRITNIKPFKEDVSITGPLNLKAPLSSGTPTFTFTAYDATGKQIKLLLESLASEGKAKVLASPHILVSDNREARIQVGSQIPLATQTSYYPTGTGTEAIVTSSITSTVQYKDIGIILKVKPQVNESGLVSLEISQEISSLGANVPIAGQNFASIDKTEATTNLVAQDGETIIIGGLIREDTTKSRAGIPLLSKIPILGYLFGSTIDESIRNELIILLTPHVMRNLQEAGDVTSDYVDRFKGATKDKKIDEFIRERSQKEQEAGD
jgi:type II secretory pathway component GspD/PulD (secretin)